jgi:SAM-dependent methyltransferase
MLKAQDISDAAINAKTLLSVGCGTGKQESMLGKINPELKISCINSPKFKNPRWQFDKKYAKKNKNLAFEEKDFVLADFEPHHILLFSNSLQFILPNNAEKSFANYILKKIHDLLLPDGELIIKITYVRWFNENRPNASLEFKRALGSSINRVKNYKGFKLKTHRKLPDSNLWVFGKV